MRIAYLIQCHKNPDQINLLIKSLSNNDCDFYIHIDKKSNIENSIKKQDNIIIIEPEKRIDVKWGQISQVEATLVLIEAVLSSKKDYDYVWLISGQDFPIKSQKQINVYLENNKGNNFIQVIDKSSKEYRRYLKRNTLYYPKWIVNNKLWIKVIKKCYIMLTGGNYNTLWLNRKNTLNCEFNFGSSWWTLTYDCIKYISNYLKEHPEFIKYYKNTVCPDESLFQTLIMNSSYKKTRKNYLTYVDWSESNRSPKTLNVDDYEKLIRSEFLIARKFDINKDKVVIEKIYNYIK